MKISYGKDGQKYMHKSSCYFWARRDDVFLMETGKFFVVPSFVGYSTMIFFGLGGVIGDILVSWVASIRVLLMEDVNIISKDQTGCVVCLVWGGTSVCGESVLLEGSNAVVCWFDLGWGMTIKPV